MNFTSKEYLPNSEERIEHLRKIIDGRPVAILAAGPSIKELEKGIGELCHADICYFGLNNFSVQETHILQQIGKHFSVMMNSARENIPRFMKDIINFLDRAEDNMFVSSFWRDAFGLLDSDFNLNQFLSKYDKKLIFFTVCDERTVPKKNNPLHFTLGNSLMMLIQLAIIGKASRIVLFGADGYCKENSEKQYYCQREYSPLAGQEALIYDTNTFFNPIMPIAIRTVYKTYNLAPIDILNCSENSFYTPFSIVSYDDAFEYLLTGKKYNRKSDLRVPKVSVISPVLNTRDFFKEIVENISNQSYSNIEHIIVYSETDEETQDIMRQFPHIRWISEKNCNHLQAFKKGISVAKGEYVFHYRIADGYLNPDWINTCVEVMENHPDISLVWGLSQYLSEDGAPGRIADAHFFDNPPPQGRRFIYYWLRKKILFPEGNSCVRKNVLEGRFPFHDSRASDEGRAWLAFNYRFNTSGYLPYFVPIVANYCRIPSDNVGQSADQNMQKWKKAYYEDIEHYKRKLIQRKIAHHYRNGSGELLPAGFSRSIFVFFDIGRYIEAKLPRKIWLLVFERPLIYWITHRWAILKVIIVKLWHQLIKIGNNQINKREKNAR